jgi:hypothetical protein
VSLSQKLVEEHGIKLSYTWVKLALQGDGISEEKPEAWSASPQAPATPSVAWDDAAY